MLGYAVCCHHNVLILFQRPLKFGFAEQIYVVLCEKQKKIVKSHRIENLRSFVAQ
jgi:hypothetical protein